MINQEIINIVIEYITELDAFLKNDLHDDDNKYDKLIEICNVIENEIPDIKDSLLLNNNSIDRDISVLLGKLKWYLAENGVSPNINSLGINKIINKLWLAFRFWFENEALDYIKEEYLTYDNWDGGRYLFNVDYNYEYKLRLGMDLPSFFISDCPTIEDIKIFIELAYKYWIKEDRQSHYNFTVNVNSYFKSFKLPYWFQNGLLVKEGYKTSFVIDEIIDYKMFERKIKFSEDMIMSKDLLEKKCALDFIIDALQYFVSLANEEKIDKKKQCIARSVNPDMNSKVYSVIRIELEEIFKISNDYFDIRHNDYLNGQKQHREPLNDSQFIEYLYNRAYALLYLIRLKRNVSTGLPAQNNV